MNKRLNIILLLVVAVLAGWYFSQQDDQRPQLAQLVKREGEPEYTGNKIDTIVYDLKGKPQYFAEAQEVKHYETTERTEFFKPLLNLFNSESSLKDWKVTADYAEITKEKILNLKGNVKIESLNEDTRLNYIESEILTVDLSNYDVYTDSIVTSKGMGFITSGKGLKGNLRSQVATLLENVETRIEPTVIQSESDSRNIQN
ncbi:LPS export ABC transporter periplasmic protein LptC [Otariodibacter oris]|uniref:Lipopolysaccharide export system protein LptC n=1 Tax=Otariodibacter oris TaxID=1032623 RepID=A0A420XHL0_9PAST|nr:LPS export ABC transporter periplasmic protein LptC [Otariodibacter oris]QGM80984.1 LPS export ABC transporter periplasmic protein LptC [Otariodibacter oris]RKR76837.1 lipopolysaccharide export system protein LptC [Otariodibacter oris]